MVHGIALAARLPAPGAWSPAASRFGPTLTARLPLEPFLAAAVLGCVLALGLVVRRLLERQQEISFSAALQRDHARFLHEASHLLGSGAEVQAALRRVLRESLELLGDAVLLQPAAGAEPDPCLEYVAERDGQPPALLPEYSSHPLVSPAAEAATSGEACVARDDGRSPTPLPASLRAQGVRAALAVPLKAGGRVLGVLTFLYRRADGPDADHVRLATLLADRAALAIEHARLYRELERMVEAQTTRLHEAQQQLLEAERARTISELAGTLAHEIRNPLNVARTAAFALRHGVAAEDTRVERQLAALVRNVDAAARIIQDLVDYGAVPQPELGVADLRAVAEEVRRELLPSGEVELLLKPPAAPVYACFDQSQLRRAVKTLILGLMELAAPDGEVQLEVRVEQQDAVLLACHSGPPVSLRDRSRVFDPLFRSGPGRTGVGFALSRRIVEENGGSLCLAEADGTGRTFLLRLPLAEVPPTPAAHPAGGDEPSADQDAGVVTRDAPRLATEGPDSHHRASHPPSEE